MVLQHPLWGGEVASEHHLAEGRVVSPFGFVLLQEVSACAVLLRLGLPS